MIDVVALHQFPHPRTAAARRGNRLQQPQQSRPVICTGVLTQGLTQGQVLGAGIFSEAGDVRRHEGERVVGILAVFGEMKTDPADLPPEGRAPIKKPGQTLGLAGNLRQRPGIQRAPELPQHVGSGVLGTGHGRKAQDQGRQGGGIQRRHGIESVDIRSTLTEVRQIARPEVPPVKPGKGPVR